MKGIIYLENSTGLEAGKRIVIKENCF